MNPSSAIRCAAASPEQAVRDAYERLAASTASSVWITLLPQEVALTAAHEVQRRLDAGADVPLAGLTFAVKDNIDVAGIPTTAAHPAFSRVPTRTATVVQRLLDAGAVLLGKTNLDQFATGLVGTRSPYGVVASAVDPDRVSGGSSSGSGAAVGHGLVDFALGTDTAGSGRIPAAFNGIVGLKPTLGLVPADGILPACPSYDTATVFAADLDLAARVLRVMVGPSAADPHSRTWPAQAPLGPPEHPVVAVPRGADLTLLSPAAADAFAQVLTTARGAGWELREIALDDFVEAARLLYDGGLVAERAYSFGQFLTDHPEGADPSVASIAARAGQVTGVTVVADQQRLAELSARAHRLLEGADALLLPTAPEHPLISAVQADPLGVNSRLGTWTNFVNLMDLAAVAIPVATLPDEGGFGVSVITRAFADQVAIDLAAQLLGVPAPPVHPGGIPVAVFGAHLRGLPLNHRLTALGARFVTTTRTAPTYRMFALPGDVPRPVLTPAPDGNAVEGEIWEFGPAAVAALLCEIPAPLALGRVTLHDGSSVIGFTGVAPAGSPDITEHGSWRNYLHHLGSTVHPV